MTRKRLVVLLPGLLAVVGLLAACSPTLSPSQETSPLGTPTAGAPQPTNSPAPTTEPTAAVDLSTPQSPGPAGTEEIVKLAQQDLAQRLGVTTEAITVVSIRPVEWPDTSLGCPEPGKGYATVIVPGHEIILEANGQQYTYHSGGTRVVYCESPNAGLQPTTPVTSTASTQPTVDPAAAPLVDKAVQDLAQTLGVAPESIAVTSVTAVQWRDSSLGCPKPGIGYLTVITPGYLILLEANGQTYEYHAAKEQVVTCQDPQPPLPDE